MPSTLESHTKKPPLPDPSFETGQQAFLATPGYAGDAWRELPLRRAAR